MLGTDADPDILILKQTKAEYAKLQSLEGLLVASPTFWHPGGLVGALTNGLGRARFGGMPELDAAQSQKSDELLKEGTHCADNRF